MKQLLNWQNLKDFCNSLTDEQLATPLKIEITEEPYKNTIFGYISPDDYMINAGDSDDYGYRNEIPFDGELQPEDYKIITKKGEPVLSCDN